MNLADYIADMPRRTSLAEALGTSPDYVWQLATNWRGRKAPLEKCPAIESATARAVTCEELRADVSWQRDAEGNVTGYTVLVQQPQDQKAA